MNLTQIARGQQTSLTFTVEADGDPEDQGVATLDLVDLDDNEESVSATNAGSGVYTATVGPYADLDYLTARLSFGANLSFDQGHIEIVGGFLFTESQARAFQDGRLDSDTKFDDADIAAERVRVTDWLEAQTAVSWVPRYRRVALQGSGSDNLALYGPTRSEGPSGGEGYVHHINRILSLTIDDEAVDTALVEIDGARLWLTDGTFTYRRRPGNVVVEYEYGYPSLRNGVDRIALLELVNRLPASRLSPNAESSTDEFGTYSWAPQNNGRPSRNPEVNAWCRSQDMRVPIA